MGGSSLDFDILDIPDLEDDTEVPLETVEIEDMGVFGPETPDLDFTGIFLVESETPKKTQKSETPAKPANGEDSLGIVDDNERTKESARERIKDSARESARESKSESNNKSEMEGDMEFAKRLHSYLKSELPAALVPRFIVILDYFPMDSQGELDLSQLPYGGGLSFSRDIAPRSLSELMVRDAATETLKLDSPHLGEAFLALGGDSVLSVEFQENLRSKIGLSPGLEEILNSESLREIAMRLETIIEESGAAFFHVRKGKGPVLALFPGFAGSLISYRDLLSEYPVDRGILSLSPFISAKLLKANEGNPSNYLESLIDEYANALSRDYPDGDFILVGNGIKALYALMTAKRFEDITGNNIKCLLAIDSLSPSVDAKAKDFPEDLSQAFKRYEGFTPKKPEDRLPLGFLELSAWRALRAKPIKSPILSIRPNIPAGSPLCPEDAIPTDLQALCEGSFKEEMLDSDHYSLLYGNAAERIVLLLINFVSF
jgi:hypothetical protein